MCVLYNVKVRFISKSRGRFCAPPLLVSTYSSVTSDQGNGGVVRPESLLPQHSTVRLILTPQLNWAPAETWPHAPQQVWQ